MRILILAAAIGCTATAALPVASVVAVASTACVLSGCSTPAKAYSTSNETFIAVVGSILDLRAAGKIKEDVYQRDILPQINRGDAILTAWRAHNDNPASPKPNIDLLKEITRALLKFEADHRSNP